MAATGEPLLLDVTTETHTYRTQERVATIQYRSSSGAPAGRAEIYEPRVGTCTKQLWRPMQGQQILDDQDFFRIAGDRVAADEIADHRARARAFNRIGFALLGVGAGAMVFASQADQDGSSRTMATVGGAGLLTAITGGLWIYYGVYHNRSENHLLPLERARAAADRYNELLSRR